MTLYGKHAFITAAGQGIGLAIANAFLREGATVTAVDIDGEKLSQAFKGEKNAQIITADARDADSLDQALGQASAIDILVNCLGWVHTGSILDCDRSDFQKSIDINITPAYQASQNAIRHAVKEDRSLSIINISSVISSISSAPQRFAYATTKAALIGMSKSIAMDFIRYKVRCNAICPGTIASPSLLERMSATADTPDDLEKARKAFDERQPIGRMGHPEEVAEMALYLAQDTSSFVTGATFTIDGGWSI